MNTLNFLARRHTGFEANQQVDIALRSLKCYHRDIYRGINSSDASIIACRFSDNVVHPDLLALASNDGQIAVQNTSEDYLPNSSIKGVPAHHRNAIFDIAWMPDELKIVTASGDHTAQLWNISNASLIPISGFHSHTGSIKTVVFRADDKNVFATGGRDGAIFIWDVRDRNNKPDNSILNGHRIDAINSGRQRSTSAHVSPAESITGLVFQDANTVISCAAGGADIKIWDLRKNYTARKNQPCPRHVLSYVGGRYGFSWLTVCPARLKLYANCLDDVIYTYNLSSYNEKPIAQFYGHQNSSYYVKSCVSPDGRYLTSGSNDGKGYIWRTDQHGMPCSILGGHTQEVTCITWSKKDEPCIVTASEDSSHRVWRVGYPHPDDNDQIESCSDAGPVETIIEFNPVNHASPQTIWRAYNHRNERISDAGTDRNLVVDCSSPTNTRSEPGAKRPRDETSNFSRADGYMKNKQSSINETYEPLNKRSNVGHEEQQNLLNSTLPAMQPTSSPTLNLPNFVTEGTAPHLIPDSPEKSRDRIDWLTRICRTQHERKLRKPELDEVRNTDVTPARRRSRSRSFERQHIKSPGLSLLNFFKVESSLGKIQNECTNGQPK